ncbi:MAG: hypothetical protein P8Y70_03210 [Candidatus Lokiarchaeota archaeon]
MMIKKDIKNSDNLFYPTKCDFYVDTNNLISSEMINKILDKFEKKSINVLVDRIDGLKFYVGGNQWHFQETGFLSYPTYEIDFKKKRILIYLAKIFERGYKSWENLQYGSLKRFIWESFCHEVIMCILNVLKIDKNLMNKAKDFDFKYPNLESKKFIMQLFNSRETGTNVNFIMIGNSLWKEDLPENLGFLEILYSRKLNELKSKLNTNSIQPYKKVKIFNELRKLKLDYKYEYNLSELINYCLYHDNLNILFRYSPESSARRNLYYRLKRLILNFFQEHNIELKEYIDGAGRRHLFLSHNTFERLKSVCLQLSIEKLKMNDLLEFEKFRNFYYKCPVCKQEYSNRENCEKFFFSPHFKRLKKQLIDAMEHSNHIDELNSKDFFFGVPCSECYNLNRTIEGRFSELKKIQDFLKKFSVCPVCNSKNHKNYLISFYYDESKKELKRSLEKYSVSSNFKGFKLNLGIPCCNCFEKVFGVQLDLNITTIDLARLEW